MVDLQAEHKRRLRALYEIAPCWSSVALGAGANFDLEWQSSRARLRPAITGPGIR
jgi:hypothetical protein